MVTEDALYYAEYFEDGWHLLAYRFQDGAIARKQVGFLTNCEYLDGFSAAEEFIFYHSGAVNVLYLADTETGEYQVLEDMGGGIDRTALDGSRYFFTHEDTLFCYDIPTRTKYVYFEQDGISPLRMQRSAGKTYLLLQDKQSGAYFYAVL